METMSLDVQPRDKSVRAKELLSKGIIPIEFYGKGVENQSFQVDYQTFRRLFRVAGRNTVIALSIEGEKKKLNAVIYDVSYHPVTDDIVHIDFIAVKMDEFIYTDVPVVLTGTAPAVKELGGILMHHLNQVEVKCLPGDLINNIEVDVESLVDFNAFIRIKDLQVPESLELLGNPEDVVVTVVAPREEEEEEIEEVEGGELEGVEEGDKGADGEKTGEGDADESKEE